MKDIVSVNLSEIDDRYFVSNPTLQKMHQEADAIQSYLEQNVDLNDINMLPYRLAQLDAYLHRLSDMQSRANAMKEYAKMSFLSQNEQAIAKMTATNSNRLLASVLCEFTVTADRIDAMHHSVSQACKNISIQISWIKKTMEFGG